MKRLWRASEGQISTILTIAGFFVFWQLAVMILRVPDWLVPAPTTVWVVFLKNAPNLVKHFIATGEGALGGLAIGAVVGIALATIMVHSRLLQRVVMPLLVIDQSIPKLALAPLFIIWFGTGMESRIFIAVVISFFPMIVNTTRGLTTIDARIGALMETLSASRLQVLLKVRLPNAVPYLFSGLKIAVPLSIIGAVVAEFVQADSGLGFVVMIAVSEINTPLVFVAVLLMAVMSLGLFAIVSGCEALLMRRRFAYLVPENAE
jgi:NitT/TauT family transport system permease protein